MPWNNTGAILRGPQGVPGPVYDPYAGLDELYTSPPVAGGPYTTNTTLYTIVIPMRAYARNVKAVGSVNASRNTGSPTINMTNTIAGNNVSAAVASTTATPTKLTRDFVIPANTACTLALTVTVPAGTTLTVAPTPGIVSLVAQLTAV